MVRKPMRGRRRLQMLEDCMKTTVMKFARGQKTEVHGQKA